MSEAENRLQSDGLAVFVGNLPADTKKLRLQLGTHQIDLLEDTRQNLRIHCRG
jgi:hypothetical protein